MSETGVLSFQLRAASDLAHRLDSAILELKKARLSLTGRSNVQTEALGRSQEELCRVLQALLAQFPVAGSPVAPDAATASEVVPGTIASRLIQERKGDLPYYRMELEQAREHLAHGIDSLTDDDLKVLDDFAAAAGGQASAVFRRMMRK